MEELVSLEKQRKGGGRGDMKRTLNDFSLDAPFIDEHHSHRMDQNNDSKSRHPHRHLHRDRSHSHDRSRHRSHRHHHHHTSRNKAGMSKEHSKRHRTYHEGSVEMLRKERDEREGAEAVRAAELFARSTSNNRPGWEKKPGGRYSVQFATL